MDITPDFVNKKTWNKVLHYIAISDEAPPFLLVDKEVVQEKISLIGKGIRNSKVFYAVKANPDREVLAFLNGFGVGFEIASEGELQILASLGVGPERIITSNPIKTLRFLEQAVSYGVNYFAYDSVSEIEKLARYAKGAHVYVRLSVPNEGSEWPLSKKFGVELDEAAELLMHAGGRGLDPVGITFHVGSQCNNVYNWSSAIDKARELWELAEQKGIALRMLNIGGGYPICYTKKVVDIGTIEKKVEKVYFIEIDEEVINVSKEFFPTVAGGVHDSRVEIKYMDGAEFVKNRDGDIDAIIVDSTDIVGFAKSLFTVEFFKFAKECLTDEGMFVTLSESLHFHKDIVTEVQEELKLIFPIVDLYTAPLATYAGNWWTFSAASKKHGLREMRREFKVDTKYYSDEIHQQAFLPPKMYEKLMQKKLGW